jgi:uncharacterized protein (DUF305 family)
MRTPGFSIALLLVSALAAADCRSVSPPPPSAPIVQPGAPGEPSRVVDAPAARQGPSFTAADVAFMQGMIHHHAQAVDMVELLKTRTNSDDMKKLGQRIELSQADEITMMRKWLEARGQQDPAFAMAMAEKPGSAATTAEKPDEHAHHMADGPMMPGMLTTEQMDRLAAARGPAFDRLFLEFMIQHHAGALTMVKDLFATPGAAQDADVFAFASDVDADQRMEIARMTAMLKELQK